MIDKIMKKYFLFLFAAIAAMICSCTSEEPIDNSNQGQPIFSGAQFTLSPIDSCIEFYVWSETELEYSVTQASDDNINVKKSDRENNFTVYTIEIGLNLTEDERDFDLQFTENNQEVQVVNIVQDAVDCKSDSLEDLEWEFNETASRQINFSANYEFEFLFEPSVYFEGTYIESRRIFEVRPMRENHSDSEYEAELKIIPKTTNEKFMDEFKLTYKLKQGNHKFSVDKPLISFDGINSEPQSFKVEAKEKWSILKTYDENLLIITPDYNNNIVEVKLNPEGDFSIENTVNIEVKADCGETKTVIVEIAAMSAIEE